jgi:hypothetical protein
MIPLIIYQTWHSKKLPVEMRESVNHIKKAAPEFTYMLFDDTDCLEFIQEYFPSNVVDAYTKLIPGAYKADLWRYCVLYVTGGIYIDIKYRPVPTFKLIQLTKSEHFVNDLQDAYLKVDGVYNGVMVCKPHNNALLKCINEIVHNVSVSYYGRSPLEPTGPILLRKHNGLTDMQLKLNVHEQLQIFFNGALILYSYLNYRKDQRALEIYPHYSRLWLAKSIYRRFIPEQKIVCVVDTPKNVEVNPPVTVEVNPPVTVEEEEVNEPVTFTKISDTPVPVEPAPVEPAPVEPAPVEPAPVEPESVEPESVEPESVEPESVEPESVEPESVEPAPDEPVESVENAAAPNEGHKKKERVKEERKFDKKPLVRPLLYRPTLNNIIFNSP